MRIFFLIYFLIACADQGNLLKPVTPLSEKEEARILINEGKYDEAISKIQSYLKTHPDDQEAQIILANVYSRKAGFNELDLVEGLLNGNQGGGSLIQQLQSSLPEATEENINFLRQSISAMKNIPEDQLTDEQKYQMALMQASLGSMILTGSAADDSGNITPESVQNLSDAEAEEAYENLSDASRLMEASGSDENSAEQAQLAGVLNEIDRAEGATVKEKTQNYLSAS